MFKLFFAVALVLATAAQAPPSLTAAEQAQLRDNLRRGELLYRYDQAAWHTSDAMVEHIPKAERSRIRGWVVTPATGADKATYFGLQAGRPYLIYSATWNGTAVANEIIPNADERRSLNVDELRLAGAILTALPAAAQLGSCGENPFNVVVLPGLAPTNPISVYFLTPQTENNLYPFGGHYRVDVQDGKIVGQRVFTKSCINLSTKGTETASVAALAITHSLDKIPTEIHVFGMFATKLPLMVIVSDGRTYELWSKEGFAQADIISGK